AWLRRQPLKSAIEGEKDVVEQKLYKKGRRRSARRKVGPVANLAAPSRAIGVLSCEARCGGVTEIDHGG
ncbi:MAG TPA: hypothetical protein VFE60_21175, partial [Roseiarcus sp.]|nr:hypothetical protein [Roseiarcus sp.]